jgi:hypothetical protein
MMGLPMGRPAGNKLELIKDLNGLDTWAIRWEYGGPINEAERRRAYFSAMNGAYIGDVA